MSIELIQQRLMQSVQVGLAIIDRNKLDTVFVNDSFKFWFKITDEQPLGTFCELEAIAPILADPQTPYPLRLMWWLNPNADHCL